MTSRTYTFRNVPAKTVERLIRQGIVTEAEIGRQIRENEAMRQHELRQIEQRIDTSAKAIGEANRREHEARVDEAIRDGRLDWTERQSTVRLYESSPAHATALLKLTPADRARAARNLRADSASDAAYCDYLRAVGLGEEAA